MTIWFKNFSVEDLNMRGKNTMADFLGIEFTEVGPDYLIAKMEATARTKQPIGIIHGGANVVLAETVASTAANAVVNLDNCYCVGLEINANHLRSVKEGWVTARAYPLHLGRSTQVWEIKIFNADNKLSCISRMTAAVIKRDA